MISVRAVEALEDLAHAVAPRLDAMRAAESYLDATAADVGARRFDDVITRYGPRWM